MAIITMDPGHGGADWGATRDMRMEKADNLGLSNAIGRELSRLGQRVNYTRQTDVFIPLQERANMANNAGANLFVSVHRNAAENPAANGFEIFISPNANQQTRNCANAVLNRVNALGIFANRGVKEGNFVVLNSTRMPAMLIEYGFISNPQDNARLDQNFDRIVTATVQGIQDCLGGTTTTPPPVTPPVAPPPTSGLTGRISTTGGALNVRSAPNTGAAVLGTLPNGSTVNILGEQNGWFRINFGGRDGWISGSFVNLGGTGTISTAGGNLNMRSAPNASASIITTIPNGTVIPITGISGDFYQTNFGGRTGFVAQNFVSV